MSQIHWVEKSILIAAIIPGGKKKKNRQSVANTLGCVSRRCLCREDRIINSCVSFYIPYIFTIFLFEELITFFTEAFHKVLLKV